MSDMHKVDQLLSYFSNIGFGFGSVNATFQNNKLFEYEIKLTLRPDQIDKLKIK